MGTRSLEAPDGQKTQGFAQVPSIELKVLTGISRYPKDVPATIHQQRHPAIMVGTKISKRIMSAVRRDS